MGSSQPYSNIHRLNGDDKNDKFAKFKSATYTHFLAA